MTPPYLVLEENFCDFFLTHFQIACGFFDAGIKDFVLKSGQSEIIGHVLEKPHKFLTRHQFLTCK